MVNKVRSYGSKAWTDHEVCKRMLRDFIVRNSTICTLIREHPLFDKMIPDEVLRRFINQEMMEREAEYVKNLARSAAMLKNNEIALKASKEKKLEESSSEEENKSSSSKSDDEDISLFMKRFKKFMRKEHHGDKKGKSKSRTKRNCYKCGKPRHFIMNCPNERKGEKDDNKEKRNNKKKYSSEAHIGKTWDFNDEDSDDDNGHVATMAVHKTSSSKTLFSNFNKEKEFNHKCFMAKESKCKVSSQPFPSPKYT
ncbi:hypothetical protein QOZ80_8AG0628270 [Eleusine coracana subsp. coracana]|nr:hypothetical protein QOZ80_8AG0628270 [Eleusine coracana subsp. coracana]